MFIAMTAELSISPKTPEGGYVGAINISLLRSENPYYTLSKFSSQIPALELVGDVLASSHC